MQNEKLKSDQPPRVVIHTKRTKPTVDWRWLRAAKRKPSYYPRRRSR